MIYDGDKVKQWAGDSQWRAWRADLARFKKHGYSGWGSEGFWALTIYRVQRGLGKRHPRPAWLPVRAIMAVVKKLFTTFTHISLCHEAEIGPGLLIPHVGLLQLRHDAIVGADCAIHHVCTFAADGRPGRPIIGDHVVIGCHTCLVGPVHIGDGAVIAAGAVVMSDVPAGMLAIGSPAKVFPRLGTMCKQPGQEQVMVLGSGHGQ